jgi:hypothetical protein
LRKQQLTTPDAITKFSIKNIILLFHRLKYETDSIFRNYSPLSLSRGDEIAALLNR